MFFKILSKFKWFRDWEKRIEERRVKYLGLQCAYDGGELGSTGSVQMSGDCRRRTRNSRKLVNANDNFAPVEYANAAQF